MVEKIITVEELARRAGVSTAYIRRLLAQGEIPGAVKRGAGKRGVWEIPDGAAQVWIAQRNQGRS